MKIKKSEHKMYLQYKNNGDDKDKICLIFKSPKKAEEFINKNKIHKNNITYYSDKRFPFTEHLSTANIHSMLSFHGSNRTTKSFKEVR